MIIGNIIGRYELACGLNNIVGEVLGYQKSNYIEKGKQFGYIIITENRMSRCSTQKKNRAQIDVNIFIDSYLRRNKS